MPEITPHELEIYISYNRLTAKSLGDIILGLARISDVTVEAYAGLEGRTMGNLPTLEVESVHTGNSVKFKFGEGWLPSVGNDKENDIVVEIPKKLGIPLMIGYAVLAAADKVIDLRNKQDDHIRNQLEIQIKQAEVHKIIACDEEKRRALQDSATHLVNTVIKNPDFKEFRICDINILPDIDNKKRRVGPNKEK